MLCRGFELLGRFVNYKKSELLKIIKLPYNFEYYKSSKYNKLSKLITLLYKKKKINYLRFFSRWKKSHLARVKALRIILIMKKHISIKLLIYWELLTKIQN